MEGIGVTLVAWGLTAPTDLAKLTAIVLMHSYIVNGHQLLILCS